MNTPQDLERKFWSALKSDMTMMLGLVDVEDGHARPMTAQLEGEQRGPIWFFSATDASIVQLLGMPQAAIGTFTAKSHDLFASVHGTIRVDNDRRMVDRLWNRFVAAWFEKGKEDPKLTLLRFDPDHAEIWLNDSSFFAGIKMLFGMDPKKEYRDKVATVDLR